MTDHHAHRLRNPGQQGRPGQEEKQKQASCDIGQHQPHPGKENVLFRHGPGAPPAHPHISLEISQILFQEITAQPQKAKAYDPLRPLFLSHVAAHKAGAYGHHRRCRRRDFPLIVPASGQAYFQGVEGIDSAQRYKGNLPQNRQGPCLASREKEDPHNACVEQQKQGEVPHRPADQIKQQGRP